MTCLSGPKTLMPLFLNSALTISQSNIREQKSTVSTRSSVCNVDLYRHVPSLLLLTNTMLIRDACSEVNRGSVTQFWVIVSRRFMLSARDIEKKLEKSFFLSMLCMSAVLDKTTVHQHSWEQLCGSCLIHFAYCLIQKLEMNISMWNIDKNHYTNYFYEDVNSVKLCVPDMTTLRDQAQALGISHIIWFGYNTDPVTQVPLDKVRADMLT